MKKKFIASLSILAVFAFAIAAYAYTQTTALVGGATASCCKSKDSCPMKMKGHEGHDPKAEHAGMSCCKKHDGQNADGKACDCCGDSCPMKKGEGSSATATADDGKNCCDSCDCCKGKAETAV